MKNVLLPAALLLLVSACTRPSPTPPALEASQTPTASSSPTQPPTSTPAQSPTPETLAGTLTTQVYVRAGPATSYASLGLLNQDTPVQVIGSDPTGEWYRILYPSAPQGSGWVAARYVQLPAGAEVPREATPTPSGPTGQVLQRLNVRSGPGTGFETLGMLEAGTQVSLHGKNGTASWFRIAYPSGPGGYGWVTAQYIQTEAAADLPVLDDFGNVVTPGAEAGEAGPAPIPTATLGPAYADGDSAAAPGGRVIFAAGGTTELLFADQLSSPQGDGEDWVEFTPYSPDGSPARLQLSLECSGTGSLQVELSQGGTSLTGWGPLTCGGLFEVRLTAGLPAVVRISAVPGESLQLIDYRLRIRNLP
jgi:uncharacterized protein YraI